MQKLTLNCPRRTTRRTKSGWGLWNGLRSLCVCVYVCMYVCVCVVEMLSLAFSTWVNLKESQGTSMHKIGITEWILFSLEWVWKGTGPRTYTIHGRSTVVSVDFFFQFELTSYLAMYTVRTIAYDVSCFLQIFYKTTLWDLKHSISTSSMIRVGRPQ